MPEQQPIRIWSLAVHSRKDGGKDKKVLSTYSGQPIYNAPSYIAPVKTRNMFSSYLCENIESMICFILKPILTRVNHMSYHVFVVLKAHNMF